MVVALTSRRRVGMAILGPKICILETGQHAFPCRA